MNWLSLISALLSIIKWAMARITESEIRNDERRKLELQVREVHDSLLDVLASADPDSVSDDEIIRG